jgi:hypothetical protein
MIKRLITILLAPFCTAVKKKLEEMSKKAVYRVETAWKTGVMCVTAILVSRSD